MFSSVGFLFCSHCLVVLPGPCMLASGCFGSVGHSKYPKPALMMPCKAVTG